MNYIVVILTVGLLACIAYKAYQLWLARRMQWAIEQKRELRLACWCVRDASYFLGRSLELHPPTAFHHYRRVDID